MGSSDLFLLTVSHVSPNPFTEPWEKKEQKIENKGGGMRHQTELNCRPHFARVESLPLDHGGCIERRTGSRLVDLALLAPRFWTSGVWTIGPHEGAPSGRHRAWMWEPMSRGTTSKIMTTTT